MNIYNNLQIKYRNNIKFGKIIKINYKDCKTKFINSIKI